MSVGKGLTGDFPTGVIPSWTNISTGYLSVYRQTSMTGLIVSVCGDVRYCRSYQFDTHGDLTWISAGSVPDIVFQTIALAADR